MLTLRMQSPRGLPVFAGIFLAVAALCAAERPGYAQAADEPEPADAPAPAPEPAAPAPAPAPELSPEELADIEAAIDQDLRARADGHGAAHDHGKAAAGLGPILGAASPDMALIFDMALASFSSEDHLQTGGHDPRATGFNLQQLEMSLSKAVDPYFRFNAHLVFSQYGVEIEEAYATTLALPWNLQARLGQFLTRVGRINSTHLHTWDFVDQPFAIGRIFGAEGNRGVGLELSYLTPLPWYVEIIASVTDAAGQATARSFFGPTPLPVLSPLDVQASLMIEQFFELGPDWSLLWGVSVATGPNATGHDNRSDVYATDLFLKYRPISRASHTQVTLQTEWFYRRRQIPRDVLADVSGYAQATWRFAERWGTALRYELGTPARNPAGLARGDYLDPEWIADRHRASANVTFWPTEFSRIRAQVSADAPAWRDDIIYAAFLAFEFTVGAHAAHTF